MKLLKRYQEKAVDKLTSRSAELIREKKEKATIVFQSPTGSGKTFMMSKYIDNIIKEMPEEELCFLWMSIGKGRLHEQSCQSLENSFGGFPRVYLVEDEFHGGKTFIEANDVVVINWEKINDQNKETGEWTNTLMRDSETNNLRDVLHNTRDLGLKIIMIIDESHASATSQRAMELRGSVIKSDLTIEMSATPTITDFDEIVKVAPADVIEEGMIKKEIIVNDNLELYTSKEITSQELVTKAAILKREELQETYEREQIEVNPLCLIQIPNGNEGDLKQEYLELYLAEQGITTENQKLAIWLSEEKINHTILTNNKSKVEYLIFKKAIATGWDCPRAQILVRFKEIKSEVLDIQTVGRILRMPEGEHYDNDTLNKAYMYINTDTFSVRQEEYNPNIIKSIFSKRKDIYDDLKLKSYYLNRVDYGDITRVVYLDLEKVFCDYFELEAGNHDILGTNQERLQSKISLDMDGLENNIINEKHIPSELFDNLPQNKIVADSIVKVSYSEEDYDNLFIEMIKSNLNGFAPKRSTNTLLNALRRWFSSYVGISVMKTFNGHIKIRNIVLGNYTVFSMLLDATTNKYKATKIKEVERRVEEIEYWNDEWEISSIRHFNPKTHLKYDYALCLYEPSHLSFDSSVERKFIEYMERNQDYIEWWWQNGSEHMALNFGIKYNTKSTFQPDFIVKFKDGRVGIFDTKAVNFQEHDNKLKAEALQAYIEDENNEGKNLVGGLIIRNKQHFYIHSKKVYHSFKEKYNEWEYFEKLLLPLDMQ